MTDGDGKTTTISFREDSDTVDWLEKYAENELETTKSGILQDHVERLENDPMYRAFHTDLYNSEADDFDEFLQETDEIDVKWIDQEKLDYSTLSDALVDIHEYAERGGFDEARERIDELKSGGYEREGIVLESFVARYED